MSGSDLALSLSTLRVVLSFDGAIHAHRALDSVWRLAAARSFVAPRKELRYALYSTDGAYALRHPTGAVELCRSQDGLAPRLEGLLYREFFEQQRRDGLCVLHASGVVDQGRAIVFAGASGAGKSALARASVETGLGYFADEHVVTDGGSIWGLPRAIHLDRHIAGNRPLPWHAGADIESYRVRGLDGRLRYMPLVAVPPAQVPRSAVPADGAVLVWLRRDDRDELAPLSSTARLSALRESTLVAADSLAMLATVRTAFTLGWRDPHAALALLRRALAAPGSVSA